MEQTNIIRYYNQAKRCLMDEALRYMLEDYLRTSYRLKLKQPYTGGLCYFEVYMDNTRINKKSRIMLYGHQGRVIADISEKSFKKFLRNRYRHTELLVVNNFLVAKDVISSHSGQEINWEQHKHQVAKSIFYNHCLYFCRNLR